MSSARQRFSPSKTTLYWLCQVGGWFLYASYLGLMLYSQDKLDARSATDILFTTACLMLISHRYRGIIIRNGWLKLVFPKLLLRLTVASLLLSVLAVPVGLLSSFLFDPENFSVDVGAMIVPVIGGTFLFFCWSLGYVLYHYISTYNRNLKWEAMINEFELNKLKSQLNPHFIFNALNSVKALVDENPEKAKASINQLSNILRSSLMMDKKKVIYLREELEIVKDYLSLEGTRFEERLSFEIHGSDEADHFQVPPMMLQTLVENGIKHGISKLRNGGKIQINTSVEEEFLVCIIRNSGIYKEEHAREGYGLKSTKQRLQLLFGEAAKFEITNDTDTKEVVVTVRIPRWNSAEPSVSATQESAM